MAETVRAPGGMIDEAQLAGALPWRLIGPHRGGRVVAVAGDPIHPLIFYFGACAGGVWKTIDGGISWSNVSDGYLRTAAVGAIAVAPSDPNVLYVGTGEACIRSNVSHGDGVYKSTDGGKTWEHLGLSDTRHIASIKVHPGDPNTVYVAALGHAYGPNEERGLFRTRDGGASWQRILYRDERTGASDVDLDPANPRILFAALWQVQRTPFRLTSGGPGSGLFRSTDGGDTWTELTNHTGLPKGVKGKIGVAVSPARAGRVFAIVEAKDGALFRSDDGGETWQRLSADGELRRRAWYYMHVYADPQNADTVWVLNIQCWKSIDGGTTFTSIPTPHGDNHDLWIDPRRPERMIEGNDGGACVSFDGSASWSTILNQPTAQFYHVTADDQFPYRVYGSQQDNSALTLPSRSSRGAITQLDWYDPGGGESGYIAVRPGDPNIVYGGAIGSGAGHGRLIRYDHRTGQKRNITVWPEVMGMGSGAKDLRYRFQWTFPISFSPHDPNVLYVAANKLLRSTDEGTSWREISPDLSRQDESTLQPSGGPITLDNTGAEVYGTIFAFVESTLQPGLFWAGTDDGLVHLSCDGGKTWQNVTPPGLPEWALISIIEASHHDPGTAYLAATRYKWDDLRPYLFKTDDFGAHWQAIISGIPETEFTRAIREDPENPRLLFVGTELGVWVSFDGGGHWQPLRGSLPVAPIYDLAIHDDDLIAATHGRSFWILDDLSPLRQLDAAALASPAHLFRPRPTYRLKVYEREGKGREGLSYRYAGPLVIAYRQQRGPDGKTSDVLVDSGQNPPDGVIVTYALGTEPAGRLKLTFLNAAGEEIRSFRDQPEEQQPPEQEAEPSTAEPPAEVLEGSAEGLEPIPTAPKSEEEEEHLERGPGLHRFVWNLRYPDACKVPGDKSTEQLLSGPIVPPGTYTVRLAVGSAEHTQTFEVRTDPRASVTPAEYEAQFILHRQFWEKLSETHAAIAQIRDLQEQLAAWVRRGSGSGTSGPTSPSASAPPGSDTARVVTETAQRLKATLDAIEVVLIEKEPDSPLGNPTRLNARLAVLATFVDSADGPPTQGSAAVYEHLATQIDEQLARFHTLLEHELPSLDQAIRAAGIPIVGIGTQ